MGVLMPPPSLLGHVELVSSGIRLGSPTGIYLNLRLLRNVLVRTLGRGGRLNRLFRLR